MTLVIANGRVVDIFASGQKKLPAEARVIDLSRMFVIPGLVDSHVHLGTQERPPAMTNSILRTALLDGMTILEK
jgi:imidazolonepropionase-like amidohydrolase